ncbi:MAG: hypothetical protein QW201_00530, partial [Thermoproteota archaeon]
MTRLSKYFKRTQERIKKITQLREKKEDIVEKIEREVFDLETEIKLLDSEISIKSNVIRGSRLRAEGLRKQVKRYERNILLTSNQ